jgi:CTP:molybdopterin cytidylyltransferase MocA
MSPLGSRGVAVVLAAGRGERFGGPKALMGWPPPDGELPLAIAHARTRLAAESRRVIVVVRDEVAKRLRAWMSTPIELLVSHYPDELGPAGSLACAAQAIALDRDEPLVVTPVDSPPAAADTVAELLAALAAPGCLAARPRHEGRGGHPVVLRASVLSHYRGEHPPPLRDLLRELAGAVRDVAVTDREVLADLDTSDDVAAWVERQRTCLS